jgi:hypothetical protein
MLPNLGGNNYSRRNEPYDVRVPNKRLKLSLSINGWHSPMCEIIWRPAGTETRSPAPAAGKPSLHFHGTAPNRLRAPETAVARCSFHDQYCKNAVNYRAIRKDYLINMNDYLIRHFIVNTRL